MIGVSFGVIENSGQRSELEKFYKNNKRRFYAIAFSKLHNRESAEDAVQEAFLRIADKPFENAKLVSLDTDSDFRMDEGCESFNTDSLYEYILGVR